MGDDTFSYADKTGDPVPCFYRDQEIEIIVNFTGTVGHQHYVEMRDFRALFFVDPAGQGKGNWIHDFNDPGVLDMFVGASTTPVTSVKFENQTNIHTDTKTIRLEGLRGPGGPKRLITFTLELGGGNGQRLVTFDPPWGERP